MIDLNATQAAIRAGYSSKWADRQAHQLLEKTGVQAEIQRLKVAKTCQNLTFKPESSGGNWVRFTDKH